MLYVTCGTIIRRVVVVARCKSSVIDFWIFFGCFVRYLDLWATRHTERSTIVDLLIKIPGPLNPAAYWKVHIFFKRSEICFKKRSKISNGPAWKFDKNIPDYCLCKTSKFDRLVRLTQWRIRGGYPPQFFLSVGPMKIPANLDPPPPPEEFRPRPPPPPRRTSRSAPVTSPYGIILELIRDKNFIIGLTSLFFYLRPIK